MKNGVKLEGFSDYIIYPIEGKIFSLKSKRFVGSQNEQGYWVVTLYDDNGKQHCFKLHRVIWMSVHGEIPEGYEVNHKTEDKNQNGIQFLELVTHKENINFGTGNQRRAEKLSNQVGAFQNDVLVMVFQSTREAQRQGFSSSNVSACCRNCFNRQGNNTYKGYQWKYIN